MTEKLRRLLIGGLASGALLALSAPAMASPISGVLQLAGVFTVTASQLNFCAAPATSCPAAPGNWTAPGTGTGDLGVPYSTDPNGGTIQNLNNVNAPVGTLLPGNGLQFLNFAPSGALPVPDIRFWMTELFPGVGGTANCGAGPAAGQECTPNGSAVTFLNVTGSSSSATLSASGLAQRISTNEFDNLQIVFTAQFNTPFQSVLSQFAANGAVTATYSGTFTATPSVVPEPMTSLLLGSGLLAFGLVLRRRSSKRS